MLTLADKFGCTVIVIPLDVAGDPVTQGVAFEVIITVTTLVSAKVEVINVAEVSPKTLTPLICH